MSSTADASTKSTFIGAHRSESTGHSDHLSIQRIEGDLSGSSSLNGVPSGTTYQTPPIGVNRTLLNTPNGQTIPDKTMDHITNSSPINQDKTRNSVPTHHTPATNAAASSSADASLTFGPLPTLSSANATAFRDNLKCLVSGKFGELCSTFLAQNITPGTDTLNSMFETTFDRVFDDEFGADIQAEIGAFICPLIGRSDPDTIIVRDFLRMLIKKNINPPQIRPDGAFDHLHFDEKQKCVVFAPTAQPAYYDRSVCAKYIDHLVRNTLWFVTTCVPHSMNILTDVMSMDVAMFVINDIAYGYARRDFERECNRHFSAFALANKQIYDGMDLNLQSTLDRIVELVRSQIIEGIVIQCAPVVDLPHRIKIHLPSAGDVYMQGRDLLCDVKKHTRACKPGDNDGRILKKDGSGKTVWDMCPELTGYLCPYPSSTDDRIDIVFTPGHSGDPSSALGYVYATVDVAKAVSPVLRDGLFQIADFLEILLPRIEIYRTNAPRGLRMAANSIDTTFLQKIIADACATSAFAMEDDVPTPLLEQEEENECDCCVIVV